MRALDAIGHALAVAGSMTWEITWSLILGFTLSAVIVWSYTPLAAGAAIPDEPHPRHFDAACQSRQHVCAVVLIVTT